MGRNKARLVYSMKYKTLAYLGEPVPLPECEGGEGPRSADRPGQIRFVV